MVLSAVVGAEACVRFEARGVRCYAVQCQSRGIMSGVDLVFSPQGRVQRLRNRLRLRSHTRADSSFFIFVILLAGFGVKFLTEYLLAKRPSIRTPVVFYPQKEIQTEPLVAEAEVRQPIVSPVDAVWQPVDGCRHRFYVFSAYVERRTVAAVRVIGATRTKTPDRVFCRLWFPGNRTITVRAKVEIIREHWSLIFSAAFVLCLLHDSELMLRKTIVGASVSVIASSAPSNTPTNLLTILDTEPKTDIKNTIHVCVKPLHFSFDRFNWMIEWMEFNRLLGVSHFYLYNKSVSDRLSCVLNYYVKQGLTTLISWKMPFRSKVHIKTEGQFAAFNDCLYRSMAAAGWLLPIDIDELVLPRRETTLVELLNSLSSSFAPRSKTPAGYLFRNVFFYLEWEDDPEAPAPIMTALKTRRKADFNELTVRSKYAVRPQDAVELGNHFLWEHVPGACSVGVPPDRAVLHHYRETCEFEGTSCLNLTSEVDRMAHKWSKELMRRIVAVKDELSKSCPAAV